MDLIYLQSKIIPQRAQEIAEGKNLFTKQPIYVVLDLQYHIMTGHDDNGWLTTSMLNYKEKPGEFGYVDLALDAEDRKIKESYTGMENPEAVTKIYIDRIIAFFFTSLEAHNYLIYQKHNLTDPYVYVFNSGYRNWEMDHLLKGE